MATGLKVMVPCGFVFVPAGSTSMTVAVQVIVWPTCAISGEQLSVVVVSRSRTVMLSEPLLALCSPDWPRTVDGVDCGARRRRRVAGSSTSQSPMLARRERAVWSPKFPVPGPDRVKVTEPDGSTSSPRRCRPPRPCRPILGSPRRYPARRSRSLRVAPIDRGLFAVSVVPGDRVGVDPSTATLFVCSCLQGWC